MGARCSVCRSSHVTEIDRDLQDPEKSRKTIAFAYSVSETSIARHVDHKRREAGFKAAMNASPLRTTDAAKRSQTHRALDSLLSGTSIVQELRSIKARADRLASAAESSGDPDVAIKALREMTRIIELQARLALEASQGRSADVSTHPIFHEVIGVIAGSLSAHPLAAQAVVQALRERLGIDVALTLQAPASEASEGAGSDLPFAE